MPEEKPKGSVDPTPPMQGGPEGTPPGGVQERPPADAPKLVTVKYGGREIQVSEDAAGALEAREAEFQRKLSEQGTELGQLRKFRETVQQTVTPPQRQEPDLDTLMFENPGEFRRRFQEQIKNEVRQEYVRDQGERAFWADFERKHKDLEGEQDLARFVMQRHWGELEALPVSQAQGKIAELTRKEILRIHQKIKGGTDEELPSERAVVEGAGGPAPRRKVTEDEGPKSLSETIRLSRSRRLTPTVAKG